MLGAACAVIHMPRAPNGDPKFGRTERRSSFISFAVAWPRLLSGGAGALPVDFVAWQCIDKGKKQYAPYDRQKRCRPDHPYDTPKRTRRDDEDGPSLRRRRWPDAINCCIVGAMVVAST